MYLSSSLVPGVSRGEGEVAMVLKGTHWRSKRLQSTLSVLLLSDSFVFFFSY